MRKNPKSPTPDKPAGPASTPPFFLLEITDISGAIWHVNPRRMTFGFFPRSKGTKATYQIHISGAPIIRTNKHPFDPSNPRLYPPI